MTITWRLRTKRTYQEKPLTISLPLSCQGKWDLILFVQPVGSYVNDGFRDMTMAEDHIRHSFSQHLDQMRERYLANIPLVYLAWGLPRQL